MTLPYPHAHNDCQACRERDADVQASYPGLVGRPLLWCSRCAGSAAAVLVLYGHVVTMNAPRADAP